MSQQDEMKAGMGGGGKSGKMAGSLSLLEQSLTVEKLLKENDLFEMLDVRGGPTNPLEWFVETPEKVDPED